MHRIETELEQRILVLDGAMGTMIQACGLDEQDFRNHERLIHHPVELKGNNDLLNITRPDVIKDIHLQYLSAGADIIETNTFNGNSISQADYDTSSLVYDINYHGARLAREAIDELISGSPLPRFVAGAIGPTTKLASMSPDVNDPGLRAVTFDELVESFSEQANALIDGGIDLFLLETITDTLNAKAALYALKQIFNERNRTWPIMVSGTITDASGRILSGQTIEAFLISASHMPLLSVGLNCALGADQLRPHIRSLSNECPFNVSIHPNAGLPDEFGEYNQSPEQFTSIISEFARNGWLNIAGGCCGTTPQHIQALSEAVQHISPRQQGNPDNVQNEEKITPPEVRQFVNNWSEHTQSHQKPTYRLEELMDIISRIEDESTYVTARTSFKKEKHLYHSEQAMLIEAQLWGRFQYLRTANKLTITNLK